MSQPYQTSQGTVHGPSYWFGALLLGHDPVPASLPVPVSQCQSPSASLPVPGPISASLPVPVSPWASTIAQVHCYTNRIQGCTSRALVAEVFRLTIVKIAPIVTEFYRTGQLYLQQPGPSHPH